MKRTIKCVVILLIIISPYVVLSPWFKSFAGRKSVTDSTGYQGFLDAESNFIELYASIGTSNVMYVTDRYNLDSGEVDGQVAVTKDRGNIYVWQVPNSSWQVVPGNNYTTDIMPNAGTYVIVPGTRCVNSSTGVVQEYDGSTWNNANSRINITSTLSANTSYEGITIKENVGETVAFGNLLYFNWTDKEYKISYANSSDHMPIVGMALEAKDDGNSATILITGWARNDSWSFAGSRIYAATSTSVPTSLIPVASGKQVQIVGHAISSTIMFFNPDSTYVEKP